MGVEWDDPFRGRHDGQVFGRRLFHCEGPAKGTSKGASLVKPQSLLRSVSLDRAFASRYGGDWAAEGDDALSIPTTKGAGRGVEVKAPGSQAGPEGVYLPDACIGIAGDANALFQAAGSAIALDLAGNPLVDWEEVIKAARAMPKLESLNLSHCLLPPQCISSSDDAFCGLTELALNSCAAPVTWSGLAELARGLPALERLHLRNNQLCGPNEAEMGALSNLANIRLLDLEGNCLREWDIDVKPLGRVLTRLRRLHLGRNGLQGVEFREKEEFPSLEVLLLRGNSISSWRTIDALGSYPRLREVRLTDNPVASTPSERHQVVARVPHLEVLNASEVTERERRDAELRYLRRVLEEYTPEGDPESIPSSAKEEHPRLEVLLQKHGERAREGLGTNKGQQAGSGKVEVDIKCIAASAGEKREAKRKALPSSATVGKLKLLCQGLFGIDPANQRVLLQVEGMPFPDELPSDDTSLLSAGVSSDSVLLIDEQNRQ